MRELADFEDDLLLQRLHLNAVYEALMQLRSRTIPTAERDRHVSFAIERVADYRELVERMLRKLDADPVVAIGHQAVGGSAIAAV